MATIFDFYRECENKYDQLPAFDFVKDDADKILKDAKPGALSQLKTLFEEDEKLMFYMLQYLLLIPSTIRIHDKLAKSQRKVSKKISQKKIRFQEKIRNRIGNFISFYRTFNPNVDDKTLEEMTLNVFKKDKMIRLEAEILNETIRNCEKENWQGKTNENFKDIICNTYDMAKGKSDNIAKLLNCLNIKTPQGKNYTKANIEHYCKTHSR